MCNTDINFDLEYLVRLQKELRELDAQTIRFLLSWLNNYEVLYYLRVLEEKNSPIDGSDRERLWKATMEEFGKFGGVTSRRLCNYLNVSEFPCPVEEPQQFKKYILEYLRTFGEIEKCLDTLIGGCSFLKRPLLGGMTSENAFSLLREEAETRVVLQELLLKYEKIPFTIEKCKIQNFWIPQTCLWQAEDGKPNFTFDAYNYDILEQLTTTLLLSLPVGKVKLSIVDMDYNRELAALKNRLNKVFVDQYILDEKTFSEYVRKKNLQLQKNFAEYGDAVEYNLRKGEIVIPYELCIVNGLPSSMHHDMESGFFQLIRQGHHAGIYFAILNIGNQEALFPESDFMILTDSESPSPLFNTEQRRELLTMLNDEVEKEEIRKIQEKEVHKQKNKDAILTQGFDDATKEFSVEMGINKNGQPVSFTLDSPHALVLGKTGSGKSNFLHLLLTESMLKYSPETLHFYLMDMKPGGVELADYRDMPHVCTLVADPGDAPINVEFLRGVKEQIEIRARRMQKAGVRDLQGYNMRNPDKKMPRIVMLIDEFHSLFDRKKYTDLSMMLEVESLLSEILTKGRSYGIHAILSTQTLMGTQIPESVAKIEKQYFLKADTFDMSDIRMFVRDAPEKELEEMRSHEAFSVDNANRAFLYFMPELLLDEESRCLQGRLHAVIEKCEKYQTKSVKSVYYSVTQLECPELAGGLNEMYYSDYPEVSIGRSVEINSQNVSVRFENAKGQNLLITGVNERGRFCTEEGGKWQGLRILLTSMISLLHYSKSQNANGRFIFLLNSPDLKPGSKAYNYFQEIKETGDVEIYCGTEEQLGVVESLLKQVKEGQEDRMTFVFIEGQDYYRLDKELKNTNDSNKDEESQLFSFGNKPFGGSGGQKQTVRDAWLKILEDGPLYGIHTIWQVQNFERALTDAPSSRRYFQNMAFLYNNTLRPVSFKMTEDIDFKRLDASNERLRMCLFDGIDVNVIAPYQIPYEDEIEEVINQ